MKTLLKIGVIAAIIMYSSFVAASAEGIIVNDISQNIYYTVIQYDDNDAPMPVSGNELAPGQLADFKFCVGRYSVTFYLMSEIIRGKLYNEYIFIVTPDTILVVLTPGGYTIL